MFDGERRSLTKVGFHFALTHSPRNVCNLERQEKQGIIDLRNRNDAKPSVRHTSCNDFTQKKSQTTKIKGKLVGGYPKPFSTLYMVEKYLDEQWRKQYNRHLIRYNKRMRYATSFFVSLLYLYVEGHTAKMHTQNKRPEASCVLIKLVL